jgi:hypothetical protein
MATEAFAELRSGLRSQELVGARSGGTGGTGDSCTGSAQLYRPPNDAEFVRARAKDESPARTHCVVDGEEAAAGS